MDGTREGRRPLQGECPRNRLRNPSGLESDAVEGGVLACCRPPASGHTWAPFGTVCHAGETRGGGGRLGETKSSPFRHHDTGSDRSVVGPRPRRDRDLRSAMSEHQFVDLGSISLGVQSIRSVWPSSARGQGDLRHRTAGTALRRFEIKAGESAKRGGVTAYRSTEHDRRSWGKGNGG